MVHLASDTRHHGAFKFEERVRTVPAIDSVQNEQTDIKERTNGEEVTTYIDNLKENLPLSLSLSKNKTKYEKNIEKEREREKKRKRWWRKLGWKRSHPLL